jgi:hypothetical protein
MRLRCIAGCWSRLRAHHVALAALPCITSGLPRPARRARKASQAIAPAFISTIGSSFP